MTLASARTTTTSGGSINTASPTGSNNTTSMGIMASKQPIKEALCAVLPAAASVEWLNRYLGFLAGIHGVMHLL
jgi:hypothetical protein